MASFFVCCCKPCLKGTDDSSEFYRLLEVPKDATPDEIRRAYKKKSLQIHPDKLAQRGQALSAADQARFQRMKEAYECLNDPKRRRLYDELGEMGMRAVEDPQSVNPETLLQNFLRSSTADRCYIFSFVLGITAFLLLWPVLLCLKVDKRIEIPWTGLWTPIWIFDAVILFILGFAVSLGRVPPPEGEEATEYRDDFPQRVLTLIQFSANVLFQIFLTLKLDKDISWRWRVVFTPWLVWEGLSLIGNVAIATAKIPEELIAMGDEARIMFIRMQIVQARQSVFNGILRIIFVILAILELDKQLNSSWWAVFTPLWIYFGFLGLSICLDYSRAKVVQAQLEIRRADVESGAPQAEEELREEAQMATSRACFNCCYIMIFLTVAILAVERIPNGGNATFSVFVVFAPLFIVIGCIVCTMGLTICTLREPGAADSTGEGTPLNPNNPESAAFKTQSTSPPRASTPSPTSSMEGGGAAAASAAAAPSTQQAPAVSSTEVLVDVQDGQQPLGNID